MNAPTTLLASRLPRIDEVRRHPRPSWAGVRRRAVLVLLCLVCFARASSAVGTGDRGYGLSVFRGSTPERFEVEILGVVEGWGAAGTTILARLSGAGLERTGVLQGMSGSPVWIDGELIGAVMSTWSFASEPIAGIRPIAEMRVLAQDIDAAMPQQVGRVDLELPNGLAWSAAGFSPQSRSDMERVLGTPLAAFAASATPEGSSDAAPSLEAGDAMAVMLVDGDARLFATGTVTERIGDTVLAFGHPLMSSGGVSLPIARADVIAVMPSREISFKIAAPTRTVGSLRLDRRAGVSGRLGEVADTLPVSVRVEGVADGGTSSYHFELARLRGMTPQLLGWAVQSAMQERREINDSYEVRLSIEAALAGRSPLRSDAVLTGAGLAQQLGSEAGLPLQLLEQLSDLDVRVEALDVRIEVRADTRVATLASAQIDDPRLVPGKTLGVRAQLRPRGAEPTWITLEVPVPERLVPGPYRLHLVDGSTAFLEEIARSSPRWADLGLRQVRDALALRTTANTLVAVLYGPSSSMIVRDVEWQDLPGTVRATLARGYVSEGSSASIVTPLARVEVSVPQVVRGAIHLPLVVEEPRLSPLPVPSTEPDDERPRRRD